MPHWRGFAACLLVSVLVAGCSPAERESDRAAPRLRPPIAADPPEQRRPLTKIEPLKVTVEGPPHARGRIRMAIDDLREIGHWDRLTRGLDVVAIRSTTRAVPRDQHLGDATQTTSFGYLVIRRVCEVEFFPAAIVADLERQRGFHAAGRFGVPPTLRHFWAALLAHELVHCLPERHGEARALEWERLVAEDLAG